MDSQRVPAGVGGLDKAMSGGRNFGDEDLHDPLEGNGDCSRSAAGEMG